MNPALELEKDEDWEAEPKCSAGLSYAIAGELLRLGIEAKGSEHGHYIGPVISHGREYAWVTLGSAIRVSDTKEGRPELQIRMIVGIGISH